MVTVYVIRTILSHQHKEITMCSLQLQCPSTLEWVEVFYGTPDSCMEAAIRFVGRGRLRMLDV